MYTKIQVIEKYLLLQLLHQMWRILCRVRQWVLIQSQQLLTNPCSKQNLLMLQYFNIYKFIYQCKLWMCSSNNNSKYITVMCTHMSKSNILPWTHTTKEFTHTHMNLNILTFVIKILMQRWIKSTVVKLELVFFLIWSLQASYNSV